MMRRIATLVREESGAVLIELAMVAPILATLVVGIADISTAYGKKLELEQAAQRAIEKVAQTTGEDTPENTIKTEAVCQYNGTDEEGNCLADPEGIAADDVTVKYSLTCDGASQDYGTDCAGTAVEVRYIEAAIVDTYEPMFPIHFGTHADGTYHLTGTAGVRVQ